VLIGILVRWAIAGSEKSVISVNSVTVRVSFIKNDFSRAIKDLRVMDKADA
jgi:hypothetical protein